MPSPDSEDALLADCSAARMKLIAKAMQLSGFARLLKADLEVLISNAMLTECPTCGGGPCDPLSHYFTPVISNANTSNHSSPDRHNMDVLGDGGLADEFHNEDGLAPFVNNVVTNPGVVPDLAAAMHQGGLDLAVPGGQRGPHPAAHQ